MVCIGLFILATPVFAEESQFTFVYTTDLLPKGKQEVEQWVTWRSQKIAGSFNFIEGRTEFEYGITDNFQGALYATYDWMEAHHNGPGGATTPAEQFGYKTPDPDAHFHATRFISGSAEGIYRLLSPYTDPIGMALYAEPSYGPKFFEGETKLILQKNFLDDTLITAFNFTYAPELRYLPTTDPISNNTKYNWQEETDMNLGLAISYRFMPNWSGGFEFLNEREFNSYYFAHPTNSGFYIGPSIHYGGKKFFVTVSFLQQLPWATKHSATLDGAIVGGRDFDNDFEKYRVRVKVGFPF
ncbi:MAG: hypothetical protein KGJ11_00065 [Candidatus Omnitrophica bacterium]|nr:hypothetical protein [Candidatus Omnitrophota bacterium]